MTRQNTLTHSAYRPLSLHRMGELLIREAERIAQAEALWAEATRSADCFAKLAETECLWQIVSAVLDIPQEKASTADSLAMSLAAREISNRLGIPRDAVLMQADERRAPRQSMRA